MGLLQHLGFSNSLSDPQLQAILRYTLPPDKQTEPEYTRNPDSSWVFDHPILSSLISKDRKLLPVGTLITRPEYADTLDTIAVSGPDAFYKGRIAQEIVDAVQADLGTLTVSDLAGTYAILLKRSASHF